jgi:cobalt/nickel transport system ATP-binding protein
MNPLLEFTDIHYTYPGADQKALRGLTLSIPAGKKSVLLGHNGCGKSTLFLHANGILKPDCGQVKWRGQPISYKREALASLRRKVGIVFQDPEQQIVASTVAEDISYGLCNANFPEAEIIRRLEDTMSRFQLEALAERPVHQLSIGEKKRVAFAGVMAMSPELLLLDEPTAGLDRLHARRFFAELEEIYRRGTTIVMATHDLDVAYQWADWIFVMQQGELVLEGSPEEVFAKRDVLESLQLGVPMLFDIWQALPQSIRGKSGEQAYPRTIDQLIKRLQASR